MFNFYTILKKKTTMLLHTYLIFKELDTENELCSWWPVSFLHKLEIENNYASGIPFHFLTRLKGNENYAQNDLFHFYTSLKYKITLIVDGFIFVQT